MKKELMKRVAAAGLAVSMVAGLTACGPTGKPDLTIMQETMGEGGLTSAAADMHDAAASDGDVTLRFSWWEAMPDIRQQRRHVRHLWKNILISR